MDLINAGHVMLEQLVLAPPVPTGSGKKEPKRGQGRKIVLEAKQPLLSHTCYKQHRNRVLKAEAKAAQQFKKLLPKHGLLDVSQFAACLAKPASHTSDDFTLSKQIITQIMQEKNGGETLDEKNHHVNSHSSQVPHEQDGIGLDDFVYQMVQANMDDICTVDKATGKEFSTLNECSGTLSFKCVNTYRARNYRDLTPGRKIEELLNRVHPYIGKAVSVAVTGMLKLDEPLEAACHHADLCLTACQAVEILNAVQPKKSHMMASVMDLLPQIPDVMHALKFANHVWSREQLVEVADPFAKEGQAAFLRAKFCPTGHYRLNFETPINRRILLLLFEINVAETAQRKTAGLAGMDTSQLQDWSNFRNARLNRMPVSHMMGDLFRPIPRAGILEFDFVSLARPPHNAVPLDAPHEETMIEWLVTPAAGAMSKVASTFKTRDPTNRAAAVLQARFRGNAARRQHEMAVHFREHVKEQHGHHPVLSAADVLPISLSRLYASLVCRSFFWLILLL